MIGSGVVINYVDKRKSTSASAFPNCRVNSGNKQLFVANAVGTNNTIVGANAAPANNDNNNVRRSDEFMIYNSAGQPKELTTFMPSAIAVAASTTITFTPNAQAATAVGDFLVGVGLNDYEDPMDMDTRLNQINSTSYPQSRLDTMTENDKIYALRVETDPFGM